MCLCVCGTNLLDCWPLTSGAIVALTAAFPPGLGQDLVMVNSNLDALSFFLSFFVCFCAAATCVVGVFVVLHIGVASTQSQGWAFLCCLITSSAVFFPPYKVF